MRLTALDGARGLFCLYVAMVHMPVAHSLSDSPFLLQGYPLLTGFFVLSGFVMAKAYGDMPATLAASGDMLLKRVARLWPLHMAALVFLATLEGVRALFVAGGALVQRAPFTEGRELGAIVENIVFVHAWGFGREMNWNYPSWTISTEFVAYLTMCAVCLRLASVRARCVAIGCAGALAAAAFAWETDLWRTQPPISMVRCVMDFAVGYLVFYAWRARPLRSRALGSVVEIAVFAAMGAMIAVGAFGWLLPAATGVFAVTAYALASGQGVISRALATRPMAWLGDVSVSIYLLHVPIYMAVCAAGGLALRYAGAQPFSPTQLEPGLFVDRLTFGAAWVNDLAALALLALVVAIAAAAHRRFEDPARRAMTSWGAGRLRAGHRHGAATGV